MTLHSIFTVLRFLEFSSKKAYLMIDDIESVNNDWKRKAHFATWPKIQWIVQSKILPCPFCGKQAQKYEDDYDGKFYVCCIGYCGGYVMSDESMDDAVKRWNSRAEIQE